MSDQKVAFHFDFTKDLTFNRKKYYKYTVSFQFDSRSSTSKITSDVGNKQRLGVHRQRLKSTFIASTSENSSVTN